DGVPDWALSPAQRAKREQAREAAKPKPPALVEHGPVEWFQAWRDITPADLAAVLARQDPAGLADGVLLEYLAAVEKVTASWHAQRVRGLGEFASRRTEPGSPLMGAEGHDRGTVRELAAHLHQSQKSLVPELADAVQLCAHFPGTVAALGEGRVDLGRATAIVRGSRDLPAAVLGEFEQAVLPGAEHVVRETVQDRARAARHRLHPQTLQERHARAMEHRGLWFRPQEDGMAELCVQTGADTAMSVYNLVQEHAKHLKTVDGETRTLAQLRADVFTDLCLQPPAAAATAAADAAGSAFGPAAGAAFGPAAGSAINGVSQAFGPALAGAAAVGQGGLFGPPADGAAAAGQGGLFGPPADGAAAAGQGGLFGPPADGAAEAAGRGVHEMWGGGNVKAFVAVTVPLATAAGGDEPGELAGYGPIPPGMARRLAGLAKSWLPVITDEHDQAVIVAREMRHPPEWLKREVRLRDETCRGLGCRTRWKHCELDHTQAWEHGGKTELDNLVLRCKPDHLAKHNDGWHTTQHPHGVIRHQTRTGQTYTSYPDGSWISHGITPPPPPPPDPFNDTTPPPF
ncbi:HNH endonuclease signature motif containing protein, partial [Arthrobacter sp. USHLN218]|uniref:HNH endonuclease signature motif containing protein n=1 Tax=Arthrobacter sp. USHLN218 TaxID=3081232 RepID=UPI003016C5A9